MSCFIFGHWNKSKNRKWQRDFLVSHAFGRIEEYTYTNSLEAFESNYAKGHRTFEVDLYLTQDKKVVLAHDWIYNAKMAKKSWTEQMPPTEEEFKNTKIYGYFTPLSYIDLLQLMREHSDIWIVTDTKYTDEELIKIQFHYMIETAISLGMEDVLDRLIIQIYNEEMYQVINKIYSFQTYIFTLYQRWGGDLEDLKKICQWCKEEEVNVITIPIMLCSLDCQSIVKHYGIDLYIHTENDAIKAKDLLKKGIQGIYTDSLSAKDLKSLNIFRVRRKNARKRKRYEKIIQGIIGQEEMISCTEWIRKKNRKGVIFGAGTYGHQIYDILKCQGIDVALFCDNGKCGCIDEKTGIRIVDINALEKEKEKYFILLCVVDRKAYDSIERQLKEAGFDFRYIRGMREYIDKLRVENLEVAACDFDFAFFSTSLIITCVAIVPLFYWDSGILLMAVLFFIRLLANSIDWLIKVFGKIDLRTIIYQLHSPLKGTGKGIIKKYFSSVSRTIIELAAANIVCYMFSDVMSNMIHIFILIAFLIVGIILLYEQLYKIGMPEYIRQKSICSKLYEKEYVAPASVRITFPREKRNLIYIYMESMEMTNVSMGNLIPHLTRLASENLSFSNTKDWGGIQQMPGTGWTMAGILASTSGISYILPIDGNDGGQYNQFLPKLESLGDILERNGYRNYFMCGSDAGFAGRDLFFRTHGNYTIFDLIQARKDGIIPEKYNNGFWGMEDFRLYEYAKNRLMEINQDSQPFNFTMLTVDTHHMDGYICEKCPHIYPQKYANVISCADNQIYDFLNWIQEQKWYKDTVVVITGDHLSMVQDFYSKYSGVRTVYNCFMNTQFVKTDIREKNRDFWMADLFPSTLGALGVDIQGNQLGLGVNLFSNKKTLAEKMGIQNLSMELGKGSDFYRKFM